MYWGQQRQQQGLYFCAFVLDIDQLNEHVATVCRQTEGHGMEAIAELCQHLVRALNNTQIQLADVKRNQTRNHSEMLEQIDQSLAW